MPVSPAAFSTAVPAQASATRTGSSIVRCGHCGDTQRVDLTQPVLAQVRPFVHAHLGCGADSVTVPDDGRH